MLKTELKKTIIIRTSSFANNFVKTMLRVGKERKELGVIFDQIGTPTYARDLAETILGILPKLHTEKPQIYHYANEGVLRWYDFSKEIMKMATLECRINLLESHEYPTPAKSPHHSLLNKVKTKQNFGIYVQYWKDSLSECLVKLGEKR